MESGVDAVKEEPALKQLARSIHTPKREPGLGGSEAHATRDVNPISDHITMVPAQLEGSALEVYTRSLQREVKTLRERDRSRVSDLESQKQAYDTSIASLSQSL
ncbi:hypothetical protein KIPB_007609, partial [Kipferlia bialata]|eukprot:g7609.t1